MYIYVVQDNKGILHQVLNIYNLPESYYIVGKFKLEEVTVVTEARNKYHGEFANHGKQDEKVST